MPTRRILARLRAECPLVFVALGLISGQIFAHGIDAFSRSLAIFVVILVGTVGVLLGRAVARSVLIGFIPGAILFFLQIPPVSQTHGQFLGTLIVLEEPRFPRAGEIRFPTEITSMKSAVEPNDSFLGEGKRALCSAIDLPWRNLRAVRSGSLLQARFELIPISWSLNPFTWEQQLRRDGVTFRCKIVLAEVLEKVPSKGLPAWRDFIRSHVQTYLGTGEEAGLVLALTLGFREWLSDLTMNDFKRVGLAHVLVFSGYQVSLVAVLAFNVMRNLLAFLTRFRLGLPLLRVMPPLAMILGSALVVGLAGIADSSARAGVAVIGVCIARFFDYRLTAMHSFFFSLVVLIVWWPGSILNPGVQLTYAALLGLWLGFNRPHRGNFMLALRACMLATLASSALCVWWFGQFSWLGFLLNPFGAPLLAWGGTVGGYMAMALSMTGLDANGYLLKLVSLFLIETREVIHHIAQSHYICVKVEGLSKYLLGCLLLVPIAFEIRRAFKHLVQGWNCLPNSHSTS